MNYSPRTPRYIAIRQAESARNWAMRAEMAKSPFAVVADRVRAMPEYDQALAACEAAVNDFWQAQDDKSWEQVYAEILAPAGGRTALLRKILAETATLPVFLSQMMGTKPISAFISMDQMRDMEARALRARQARLSGVGA